MGNTNSCSNHKKAAALNEKIAQSNKRQGSSRDPHQAMETDAAVALSSLASTSTHSASSTTSSVSERQTALDLRLPLRRDNSNLVTPPTRCSSDTLVPQVSSAPIALAASALQQQQLNELVALIELQNVRSSLAAAAFREIPAAAGLTLPALTVAQHQQPGLDNRQPLVRRHTLDHLGAAPVATAAVAPPSSALEAQNARAAILLSATAAASSRTLLSEAIMAAATSAAVVQQQQQRRMSLEHLKAADALNQRLMAINGATNIGVNGGGQPSTSQGLPSTSNHSAV